MTADVTVDLDGVPETMLWPLWNRAHEARRSDRLIEDAWSIDLTDRLDYDFAASFGRPNRSHGIRARVGDDLIRDFIERHGAMACLVRLGERLATTYRRIGKPNVPWLSVDLPESIAVRGRLLPPTNTLKYVPCSALDLSWMDQVPEGCIPFISAAGLLMYFTPEDNQRLLRAIAERFPGAELYFDAIPMWMSKKTMKGMKITKTYTVPPCPWGIAHGDIPAFLRSVSWDPVSVRTYAEPFPHVMRFFFFLSKIAFIKNAMAPSLVHARASTAS